MEEEKLRCHNIQCNDSQHRLSRNTEEGHQNHHIQLCRLCPSHVWGLHTTHCECKEPGETPKTGIQGHPEAGLVQKRGILTYRMAKDV
jgi:hypothetical protein